MTNEELKQKLIDLGLCKKNKYLTKYANSGISVTIPENDVRYVLVNIDPAYAYLIRQGRIVSEKTEFYKIDRKLFDEVFEKV